MDKYSEFFEKTLHFEMRQQQRGISDEMKDIILDHADKKIHHRDGALLVFITMRKLKSLARAKKIKPAQVDKLNNKALLIGEDNHLITAYWMKPRRKSRKL